MALSELPNGLENLDSEHCFESGLGMTLAHFSKLGELQLSDIVEAISRPGEEVTPMSRALAWLHSYGLQIDYIEKPTPQAEDHLASLVSAGITYVPEAPTMATVFEHSARGNSLLTQINYEPDLGQPDFELNHIVYLAAEDDDVLLIDPDGFSFGVDDLSPLWGRFPNLISVREK
jgi:hypothetical protein